MSEVSSPKQFSITRIIAGFSFAIAIALSAYLILTYTSGASAAFASLWFLALLPAILCAIIVTIGDPRSERSNKFYFAIPIGLVGCVCVSAAIFLNEGLICIIMIAPIWLVSGMAGAFLAKELRKRNIGKNTLHASFVFIPLIGIIVESYVPIYPYRATVSKQIVIMASPSEIWPYVVSTKNISSQEGQWNFTQNIAQIPRPRSTSISHHGIGGIRTAYWGDNIHFDEIVTAWKPNDTIGWRFNFTDSTVQNHTDEHISPDGEFLKIDSGEYILRQIADNKTILVLNTHYVSKTHVNAYARLWGELFLGDIQNNVLLIIKNRAEPPA